MEDKARGRQERMYFKGNKEEKMKIIKVVEVRLQEIVSDKEEEHMYTKWVE